MNKSEKRIRNICAILMAIFFVLFEICYILDLSMVATIVLLVLMLINFLFYNTFKFLVKKGIFQEWLNKLEDKRNEKMYTK